MSGQYRLIYFIPDHSSGTRHAIGGIISTGAGVFVTPSKSTPSEECVGGAEAAMMLRKGMALLGEIQSFDELPMSFGPHFVLGSPRKFEPDIEDPTTWIQEEVLPKRRCAVTTKIDWQKYDDTPRPKRPLTIAIDWDQTWTADPDLWSRFVEMAQAAGHTVYIVTARPSANTSECMAAGVKVIATAWQAKRPFCDDLGIQVDIWIDDCPEFI